MYIPLTTKIHRTYLRHTLQCLNGPFRLTICLRKKVVLKSNLVPKAYATLDQSTHADLSLLISFLC